MQIETDTPPIPIPGVWSTLEELLLACAVNKHGTTDWNCIVTELQTKTSSLLSLTSQHCIDKFNDLKRRFFSQNHVVLVDELRKLRVLELKRQLHHHDVSIVSLETKVKRLEEERERGLRNEEFPDSPEKKVTVEKLAGGEDSDRSVNESTSTNQQKAQNAGEVTVVKTEPENDEPVRTGSGIREMQNWSHNGKLEDDDEENNVENKRKIIILGIGGTKRNEKSKIKLNRAGNLGSGGLVSESNNNNNIINNNNNNEWPVESKKQNTSDVQSSVSLSLNKKKRRGRGGRGSSSYEEPDEVSPTKRLKFETLNDLLEIIRAHRLSSTFERRLRSQESERYKSLIRQHVDLRMVQSRLDKGIYSNCIHKFFRDLLLLFNNAILFFRKNSPENLAAKELRAVVRKEMTRRFPKPASENAEPKIQPLPFSKPNKASSMVACGKRSSMKAITSKKGEKKDGEVGEKPNANEEKIESSFEDKSIRKKRSKERSVSGLRNKSAPKNNNSNINGEIEHQYGANELSSHDGLDLKLEKKASTTRKKQGAAIFLKRIKQNSPGEVTENDGNNDENSSSENESKDGKTEEEEKKKRGGQSKQVTERQTRSARGRGGRGKKAIGRSPKKPAGGARSRGGVKRGRDNGDSEAGAGSGGGGRVKKRTRR